jgi:hypothetical protein
MRASDELFEVADRLERASKSPELAAAEQQLTALQDRAQEVGRAASGSWLGYQANVYYADFQPPPSGAHFSQEWGLKDLSFSSLGSRGDWRDYDPHEVLAHIREGAGSPDLSAVTAAAEEAGRVFTDAKADVRSILLTENADSSDSFLSQLVAELDKLEALDASDILEI